MRKIHYITESSSFEKDVTPNELAKLIEEHHSLYMKVFETHLVPKLHFWIHIPTVMEKHGLYRILSTIRGEAKHRFFKRVAASITSRKCPAYTLSLKHQLQWAGRILKQDPMQTRIIHGVKRLIDLNAVSDSSEFKNVIPINLANPHSNYPWIKYDGTLYKPGITVCIDNVDDNLPKFAKISYIIESGNDVYFVVQKMNTIKFGEHIQAFYVEESQSWQWITKQQLATHITYSPQILPSKETVISKMYY